MGLISFRRRTDIFDTLPDSEKINNQQNLELVVKEILEKVGK